jgi:hypothetical protein
VTTLATELCALLPTSLAGVQIMDLKRFWNRSLLSVECCRDVVFRQSNIRGILGSKHIYNTRHKVIVILKVMRTHFCS